MHIFRGGAAARLPVDPASFVGNAHAQRLGESDAGTPVVVYRVDFEPGARTNWHIHSGAQWLLVVEGRIRIQKWSEPAQDLEAGDAVVIAPGEKHWHGALPSSPGSHFAINVKATTEWLEAVTDEQYAAR